RVPGYAIRGPGRRHGPRRSLGGRAPHLVDRPHPPRQVAREPRGNVRAPTAVLERQEGTMLQRSSMYSYIPATDLERARRFYEEKLGFTPKLETNGGVVYECAGGTAAFLYPTPNAGASNASQACWP